MTQPDYNSETEKGDFLEGQPQYEKYIGCSELRVQPCTFGVHSVTGCPGGGGDGGPGGGGDGGGGGGTNACFSFGEFYTDEAPTMDGGDLSKWIYCYDAHLGDDQIDMGLITEPVDSKRVTSFLRKQQKQTFNLSRSLCN